MSGSRNLFPPFIKGGIGTVFLTTILSGCIMVGPDYHRPEMKGQPQKWDKAANISGDQKAGFTYEGEVDLKWWRQFNDQILNNLIEGLGKQNLDIQEAATRISQARGQLKVVAAAGMPNVNWAGSYSWQQQSEKGMLSMVEAKPDADLQFQLYSNIGQAAWDLDLFGMIRRSVEAGKADIAAVEAARKAVVLASLSDLVDSYMRLRGVQEQLNYTEEHLQLVKRDLNLVLQRQKEGASNSLEVAQARGEVEKTKSELPPLKKAEAALINAIGYLLALPPRQLEKDLLPRTGQPAAPISVGVGLPSTLAQRRPDIMEAEAKLHAATALVGSAKAAFYPDINLVGNLGTQSLSASDFFMSGAKYFDVGPTVTIPIFQGGRLSGTLKLRKSQQKEAALEFRRVVLNAWREVDDAVTDLAHVQARYDDLKETVHQNQIAVSAARERYKEGAVPFLEVDRAEALLLANAILLAESRTETNTATVNLYRALGGGWQTLQTANDSARDTTQNKTRNIFQAQPNDLHKMQSVQAPQKLN
ncbi:efflux transporter outer membrane subunit [Aristophania vespae]|uniref:efflux transporter outer membrane subunit n=1 Tax=Aristophania vespae TaxID=2697033 RepID=UPI0023515CEF|nr:efflux transporter outer membrane subunit [Aristophania vespae]UMM63668.1 Cation efflux system protein CusC [Aristophania vespae]